MAISHPAWSPGEPRRGRLGFNVFNSELALRQDHPFLGHVLEGWGIFPVRVTPISAHLTLATLRVHPRRHSAWGSCCTSCEISMAPAPLISWPSIPAIRSITRRRPGLILADLGDVDGARAGF